MKDTNVEKKSSLAKVKIDKLEKCQLRNFRERRMQQSVTVSIFSSTQTNLAMSTTSFWCRVCQVSRCQLNLKSFAIKNCFEAQGLYCLCCFGTTLYYVRSKLFTASRKRRATA